MHNFKDLLILPGSHRNPAALLLPAADPKAEIGVSLHLRRNRPLPKIGKEQPFLTRAQLNTDYGASDEDIDLVWQFANAMNLSVESVDKAKCLVKVRGLIAHFNDASNP